MEQDREQPLTRRQFLGGPLAGAGLSALAWMLQEEAAAAPAPAVRTHFPARAKNCIFIHLLGGTSQIELFDPKPTLDKLHGQPIPASFREGVRLGQTTFDSPIMGHPFKFRRYGKCGMEMSELLPHVGECADDLCLIRSMYHEAFDHAPGELVLSTGKDLPGRPSTGSWLTYGLGRHSQNLPDYVVLMNGRAPKSRRLIWGSGFLPATHEGVLFRTQGSPILDLKTPDGFRPEIHRAQLEAMRKLNELRKPQNADPRLESHLAAYELAFKMQSSAPELLDLSGESEKTRQAYGDGDFARSLLLSRRLVERGVRFVSVTHNEWDHHESIHATLPRNCKEVDQPIGALLKDLKQRGLLDSTLVVWGTEFGRTAITQGKDLAKAGRDHHPHAFSVWLAGGGVKGGQVIGETDELAWRVTRDGVHIHDFHATLLHLFGLDHTRLTFRYQGLEQRLTDVAGRVVRQVLA